MPKVDIVCNGCGQTFKIWPSWMRETFYCSDRCRPGPAERFLEKIYFRNDGCWIWTSAVAARGVPKFTLHGESRYAHHVAWEWRGNEVPNDKDLWLVRTCYESLCVNPDHMAVMSPKAYAQKKAEDGIMTSGEDHHAAILTWDDVRTIRRLFAESVPPKELAERYEMTLGGIHAIVRNETWHDPDYTPPENVREIKFWRHVDRGNKDECWLWRGVADTISGHVYPIFTWRGAKTTAYRVACELETGKALDGRHVTRTCDEPLCVNPYHVSA